MALKKTWTDLDMSFENKLNGDINIFEHVDAIKSSMRNIMQTMQGSRRMLPNFAKGVYELLFEPMDEITANFIGEGVLDALQRWESRIIINNIDIIPYYDQGYYEIKVTFKLKNLEQSGKEEEITQILVKK